MTNAALSDEAVVEKAPQVLAAKRRLRWIPLMYAGVFLGLAGGSTVVGLRKIESIEELTSGFVLGLALAIIGTSFGLLGALCLAKFLIGFDGELQKEELLVRYHDHLREPGQLPDDGDRLAGLKA